MSKSLNYSEIYALVERAMHEFLLEKSPVFYGKIMEKQNGKEMDTESNQELY